MVVLSWVALVLICTACDRSKQHHQQQAPGLSRERTIVLIVMDTVRSDAVSFCGAPAENTPNLKRLATLRAAAWSCRGLAASGWTLPSHATLFTGLLPHEHGAHWVIRPGGTEKWEDRVSALAPEYPRIAEKLTANGYQSFLVSSNPLIRSGHGLERGFSSVRFTKRKLSHGGIGLRLPRLFGAVRPGKVTESDYPKADAIVRETKQVLREADSTRPLFLVVNLMDAHGPWPFSDAEGEEKVHPYGPLDPSYAAYQNGTPEEKKTFIAERKAGYQAGVKRADWAVGEIFSALQGAGWFQGEYRVVIASDHGEYLGEHDLLGHGHGSYEQVSTVPILVLGSESITLPDPVSAVQLHDYLITGKMRRQQAVYEQHPDALWKRITHGKYGDVLELATKVSSRKKVVQKGGQSWEVDLARDPGESSPRLMESADPFLSKLEAEIVGEGDLAPRPSVESIEALRAIGYIK